jgi:hypothetical protein
MAKPKLGASKDRRGALIPPIRTFELKMLNGWIGYGLLNHEAPEGTYAIDAFANTWVETESPPNQRPVQRLRSRIEQAAVTAVTNAHINLHLLPESRNLAVQALKDINKGLALLEEAESQLEKAASIIQQEVHIFRSQWTGVDMEYFRDNISKLVTITSQIKANSSKLVLSAPKPPHYDPLVTHFIRLIPQMWQDLKGAPPGISANGPFVRLLAAAWKDLSFPVPDDNRGEEQELVSWLGTRAEREVRRLRKLSSKI